jgi:hypothetical protein
MKVSQETIKQRKSHKITQQKESKKENPLMVRQIVFNRKQYTRLRK